MFISSYGETVVKIIKILLSHSKNLDEEKIRGFLYSNFPNDLMRDLEYDDPKAIARALKLLNVKTKIPDDEFDLHHHDADSSDGEAPDA